MRSNAILSLIAALAVCVAGSSLARAESAPSNETGSQAAGSEAAQPTQPKKSKKVKKHTNKTQHDKLERGNPHSVIYKGRKKSAPSPTNDQINEGEKGNPDAQSSGR